MPQRSSGGTGSVIDLTAESPPNPVLAGRYPSGRAFGDWGDVPRWAQSSTGYAMWPFNSESEHTSDEEEDDYIQIEQEDDSAEEIASPQDITEARARIGINVAADRSQLESRDQTQIDQPDFEVIEARSSAPHVIAGRTRTAQRNRPNTAVAPRTSTNVHIHDSIPQGPYNTRSRIPQSTGVLASSSSAAAPPASRRRVHEDSDRHVFGTGLGMDLIGSFLQSLRSRHGSHTFDGSSERPGPAAPKPPATYDPKSTHPYEVLEGFVHTIIEPPVDLETYFDDREKVTGPLPETTPICAGCRRALVTGGINEHRMWALPCGHVIDGLCIDQLSGLTPPDIPSMGSSKRKGKVKAVESPEEEPLAKVARPSDRDLPRTAATISHASPRASTIPSVLAKPKRFQCPVQDCKQKCSKEPGGKLAAWPIYE